VNVFRGGMHGHGRYHEALCLALSWMLASCAAPAVRLASSLPEVAQTIERPSAMGTIEGSQGASVSVSNYEQRLAESCRPVPTCELARERVRLLDLGLAIPGRAVRPLVISSVQWLLWLHEHGQLASGASAIECPPVPLPVEEPDPSEDTLAPLGELNDELPSAPMADLFVAAVGYTRDAIEQSVTTPGVLAPFARAAADISGAPDAECALGDDDAARLALVRHLVEIESRYTVHIVLYETQAPDRCFAVPTLRGPAQVSSWDPHGAGAPEPGPGFHVSEPQRQGQDLLFSVLPMASAGGNIMNYTMRRVGDEWRVVDATYGGDVYIQPE
jgi:hypothetical protein